MATSGFNVVFQHNFDTAFKKLALEINEALVADLNLLDIEELNSIGKQLVYIVPDRLKNSIDELVSRSKKDASNKVFPRVFLVHSHNFKPTEFTKTHKYLSTWDSIDIENKTDPDEKLTFLGTKVQFEIPSSIVILSKSRTVNQELGLRLLTILNSNSKYFYPIQLKNNTGDLWMLENYGSVAIKNLKSTEVSMIEDDGYIATSFEFGVYTNYLNFKEWDNILREYEVNGELLLPSDE